MTLMMYVWFLVTSGVRDDVVVEDGQDTDSRTLISTDLDAKMDLIRTALDSQALSTEERDACIRQFVSIQNKDLELVNSLRKTQQDHRRVRC